MKYNRYTKAGNKYVKNNKDGNYIKKEIAGANEYVEDTSTKYARKETNEKGEETTYQYKEDAKGRYIKEPNVYGTFMISPALEELIKFKSGLSEKIFKWLGRYTYEKK